VLEQLGIERIELRVVDIGLDHALFEVVEPNRVRGAAEIGKAFFVQPAPDFRRRVPHRFLKRVPAVAQGECKEPRAAVFAGARIAGQRAFTVIHLHLLARLGFEPAANLRLALTQLAC
jgi:hypothetical protein